MTKTTKSTRNFLVAATAIAAAVIGVAAGDVRNASAYCGDPYGGGSYGGGGYEECPVDEGYAGSGGGGIYCDEGCTFDSLCSTACIVRTATCSTGIAVAGAGDYATDTGTTQSGVSTNGQAVLENQQVAAAGDTGVAQSTGDQSLVCNDPTVTETWSTCGAQSRCLASSGDLNVPTQANMAALPCPTAATNSTAQKSTKPSHGSPWFKLDYRADKGTKATKDDAAVKAALSFGVSVFGLYVPIAVADIDSSNGWGAAAQAVKKGKVKISLLGVAIFESEGGRRVMKAQYRKALEQYWGETGGAQYNPNDPDSANTEYAKRVVADKKSITWNTPRVGTFVGPVYVSVYAWAKAGFDINFSPDMVTTDGKLIGISVTVAPKGFLHAGATASASIVLAAIGISGTINLLTVALRGKLTLAAQNPSTLLFDMSYLKAYLGLDIDLTSLDGSIKLWIRVLFKKWTIKLADWVGIRRVWTLGNQYHASCSNLSNGTSGSAALGEGNYTETGTPP